MNNKTILVSGAGGFLGKELIRQLLKNKFNTIALSSQRETLVNLFRDHLNLTILDTINWKNKLDKDVNIDVFINCAFPRSSQPKLLSTGIDFTEKIIKDVIDFGIKNIINISSQSVYSQKNKLAPNENSEVSPESLYGMAKYATERIISVLCKNANKNINYSNIRLGSLIGTGLDVRMTNKFVKAAIEGRNITINGKGQKISYLDVRDAATALIAMVDKDPNTWKEVYNLGNSNYYSVLEIAETVNKVAKRYLVPGIEIELEDTLDDFNNLIDCKQFYSDFNWEPKYDLNTMIEDLFSYYMSKY